MWGAGPDSRVDYHPLVKTCGPWEPGRAFSSARVPLLTLLRYSLRRAGHVHAPSARAMHWPLERALLQCMEHSHAHAALRFTAQSVPHAQIGRPEVVGKSRAEKKNVAVQHEAGPSTSTPAPAGDIPSSLPCAAKSVAPQALRSICVQSQPRFLACLCARAQCVQWA